MHRSMDMGVGWTDSTIEDVVHTPTTTVVSDVECCHSLPTAACRVLAEIVLAAHGATRKGKTEAA
jgi:hypothetical protein